MDETRFFGLTLATEPGRVMTPRPATEQLVAAAIERIGDAPARVADVGTGSGAVALAIATAAPRAEVWATDTSRSAVALARENARRHPAGARVRVRHADLLHGVPAPLDLIVANLPYLPASAARRHPELAGEPHAALYAAGDGLDPYRRLLAAGADWLAAAGAIVIQLHRRVLAATATELAELRSELERVGALVGGRAAGLAALPAAAAFLF